MPVFFFTDIEGSTRLWEDHTDEMLAVIARHDAILREAIEACGGMVTKHTGDGITAAFPALVPDGALRGAAPDEGGEPLACALRVQKQFADEAWGAIGELRIRVGLHAGAAELHAGDYFGPPVNATARVMSAAWGGQILLTPEVTGRSPLPVKASLLDLGQHLLRNVSAPQRIYQLVHPDLPRADFPPPRSLSGHAISQVVGREGARLAGLQPEAMAVSLVSATLLPALMGDQPPHSEALANNLGVLRDLGSTTLAGFLAEVAPQLAQAQPGEIRRQLEAALLVRWQVDELLRTDASRLLRAVRGVDAAMETATSELREALAEGFNALGNQFTEFHWMLGDLRKTLVEVRSQQDLQLALQREQLAKTKEMLELQRDQRCVRLRTVRSEPAGPPAFLKAEDGSYRTPVFVSRDRELARLEAALETALGGMGQVVFVTGDPGRGKTALLSEFSRRAMVARPNLLVALGSCNAYSGVGDPYLPFREVLDMLTGDVEGRWASGLIATDHARRLWSAIPAAVQALLDHGPHVAPALVSAEGLLSRALTAAPDAAPWLEPLEDQLARVAGAAGSVEQSNLFQQVTGVLRALSQVHPLLLIVDDLHWADPASIGLLFHIGRRLEGARVLIVGAYRPAEVALGRAGARHPLENLLGEFKRIYGDVWLDLADTKEVEQRRFVDAYLETEPNSLSADFRRLLAEHTGGHPLFTVELLRDMQARGDLYQDEAGRWTQRSELDWERLPARVEGVIKERVDRLEPELREVLSVASIEGETFTVAVVAELQGMSERQLLRALGRDLQRRHGLVVEQTDVLVGHRRLSRFRFSHALLQNYLYQQLSQGERRLLHAEVAAALETCYGERADDFAVQLAQHYHEAGDDRHALAYFTRAADNASRVYANEEAFTHFTAAIETASRVPIDPGTLIALRLGRGVVSKSLGDFTGALADYGSALEMAGAAADCDSERLKWRALINLGGLWSSRDYQRAHECFRDALDLARRMSDRTVLAGSLNGMGNWFLNAEESRAAIEHHLEALVIFEELGDKAGLAATLDLLGIASLFSGDLTASVAYYDRAIALFRELGDLPSLANSLTGQGHSACWPHTLAPLISPTAPEQARRAFEEAARISREIGSPASETWSLWSLGQLHTVQGRYGHALRVAQSSLDIATQTQNHENIVASQAVLGFIHRELLAPELALPHLKAGRALAEEVRSRVLIHWASGALAETLLLLDETSQAQMCLSSVVSANTPMDSLYKRYCWAMRGQLALCQGDSALALEIVERLIASAPRMSPGRVITFLWKQKGEALSHMGHLEEALAVLRTAANNARATGERSLLWRIHAQLGRLHRAMGQELEARAEISTATAMVEKLASTLPDGELRASFTLRAHDLVGSL